MSSFSRRNFVKTSIAGGLGATMFGSCKSSTATAGQIQPIPSDVCITTGDNRADMVFRALQPFSKQISQSIGQKQVVLKPNMVSIDIPLCATHVDTLEGILEFMKSIGKLDQCIIAESSAQGPALEGFSNYGYMRLFDTYPTVKPIDLDETSLERVYALNERDYGLNAVRVPSMLLDNNSYVVSVSRMKTHNAVVATLSLKNIVMGAPVKDIGFVSGPNRKPGLINDKRFVHNGSPVNLNYNLFALAPRLHPHLAIIDGFEGMEGNGPNRGTPVDHRVCVTSLDWLAADRVGVELMGLDIAKVRYLNFCNEAGFGVGDIDKIKIIGEPISAHIKKYKLSDNIEDQLNWMNSDFAL